MDFIVPIAVELVAPQTHACKFVVFNFCSSWVRAGVKFGADLQSLRSGCGGNEIDNYFEAQKRFSARESAIHRSLIVRHGFSQQSVDAKSRSSKLNLVALLRLPKLPIMSVTGRFALLGMAASLMQFAQADSICINVFSKQKL